MDPENAHDARTPKACLPAHLRKPRLRRVEAAQYLELVFGLIIAPATLAKKASLGGGPSFQKALGSPLYLTTELDRWALEKLGALRATTRGGRQHV